MDDEKAIEWIERARDYFVPEFGAEASEGTAACEYAIQAIEALAKVRADNRRLVACLERVLDVLQNTGYSEADADVRRTLATASEALDTDDANVADMRREHNAKYGIAPPPMPNQSFDPEKVRALLEAINNLGTDLLLKSKFVPLVDAYRAVRDSEVR